MKEQRPPTDLIEKLLLFAVNKDSSLFSPDYKSNDVQLLSAALKVLDYIHLFNCPNSKKKCLFVPHLAPYLGLQKLMSQPDFCLFFSVKKRTYGLHLAFNPALPKPQKQRTIERVYQCYQRPLFP